MSKEVKILISIAVVIVLVGTGYVLIKGVKKAPIDQNKMAFAQFINNGGAYKCTVKESMNDFPNSGTVYIDGTKIRANLSTIAEGKPMSTSILLRDGYSYTWSSLSPKMGLRVKSDMKQSADMASLGSRIGNYNCEPWTVDQTMFVAPANITFKGN